jgi:hypothetical protein
MTSGQSLPLRAIARNAVTWAFAWGAAGGTLVAALTLLGAEGRDVSFLGRIGLSLLAGVGWGIRFGVIGAVMGTLFSAIIRFGYRGRKIAHISPVGFALVGAVVGGVGVPLFLQLMNVVSGGAMIAWNLVSDDALWASIFGGAAAGGSILLARRADALAGPADPRELDAGDGEGNAFLRPRQETADPARARHRERD